jgi:ABC-2 type transport system permease protein
VKLIALLFRYFRFNLAAGVEYRVAFLTQVIGMFINDLAFLFFWILLYEKIGQAINGYQLKDVLFLWSLSATGFGLADLFLGNSHSVSRIIYSGELDVYILQPKPILLNLLVSRMNVSGLGDFLYGVALFLFSQPIDPAGVALFALFSVLSAMLFTAVRVFYHSLTFFLGNAETLALTVSDLSISFTLYPGSIFKGLALWILHSLVPAALMAFIPITLFKDFEIARFLQLLAADIAVIAVSVFVFYRGLRRYESGNKIGARL